MGVATYRDHLASVKREIREISPKEAAQKLAAGPRPVLLDVRERDEWEQGHIPGAIHIPRGNLESRIDNAVPDRNASVIVYCAAGNRSAYAAKTLAELGFGDVLSISGGFSQWKQNGHEWKLPR
ncbi:MAG: sulfur-carrier protein adenylyltransferase/sulfurtransferase, partial [Gaiellales bacterium]|nr:sulfur-carrier protein adenylyltransferase/sulfurtransferase [Gaiellales bacterium]